METDESLTELLTVEEVAHYLGVRPVTIYRWCREGRLPAIKVGKSWRIRRTALAEFLRRGERSQTLADLLNGFLTVPDHVLAVASNDDLLRRLDAAFFQVGEARGGLLVKAYADGGMPVDEVRGTLTQDGLDVAGLEAAGRLQFKAEVGSQQGRADELARLASLSGAEGRSIWVSFNWATETTVVDALWQQEALAAQLGSAHFVVKTAVLAEVVDAWPTATQRRAQALHQGAIWMTEPDMVFSRASALPAV